MLPLSDQIELQFRQFIGKEIYESWLRTPNTELNMHKPLDLLRKKDYQPLWSLIYKMNKEFHQNVG